MEQPERGQHRSSLRIRIPGVHYNLVSGFSHVLIFFWRRHAWIMPRILVLAAGFEPAPS